MGDGAMREGRKVVKGSLGSRPERRWRGRRGRNRQHHMTGLRVYASVDVLKIWEKQNNLINFSFLFFFIPA